MSEEYTDLVGARELVSELRARITDGVYPLGSLLPTQRKLAEDFGISRDTVQRALRELKNEGWIETKQGSGSRVVKTQRIASTRGAGRSRLVTLEAFIREGFQQPKVTLDVYTLSSESLERHIRNQVELIRSDRLHPESIAVRILLPDEEVDCPYGLATDGSHAQELRERFREIQRIYAASLSRVLGELKTERLVPSVEFDIRRCKLVPAFKVYLINGELLHGFYVLRKRPVLLASGEEVDIWDVMGTDAGMNHYVRDADPETKESSFVRAAETWFESAWDSLASP